MKQADKKTTRHAFQTDMHTVADFQSDFYQDSCWKKLFCESGIAVSANKTPIGLANGKNLIMASDDFYIYDRIQIIFPVDTAKLLDQDFLCRSLPSKLLSGIVFLKIDSVCNIDQRDTQDEMYILFLQELLTRIKNECRTIFQYTYDHLSHRYYDHCVISKIPIIQSDFSEIYLLLEKLTIHVNNIVCINDVVDALLIAIDILSMLSKLSGARSVLKNRSVEFIFHLTLFKKFIADAKNPESMETRTKRAERVK